jgi:prophage DNA circulation protein
MADLHAAQLDGFALEIESIDDAIEKAIVRHEYPYKNGALLEDMGQKARVVKFRCYFWDDGADHATYDTHTELLKHLDSMEISELVHPKYGPMKGCVESMAVRHDDRDRTAEIDITFVEGLIEEITDASHADIEAGAEEAYNAGITEQMQEFSDDVTGALGAEAPGILAQVLDPALGIVEQFDNVSTTARNYLKDVESYVGGLEAALNTVANPANSLVATINYGTSLAGRVIGSVTRCVERYAQLYDSLKTSPARFVDSMVFGTKALSKVSATFGGTTSPGAKAIATSSTFTKTTTIAAASHTALQTAYLYKDDQVQRVAQKKAEGVQAFDTQGNYTAPDQVAPAMTVAELEKSLAQVRGYLQEAIDLSRQMTSLKEQAVQLQVHINNIKLEREKIIRVQLDNPMPLHLVCLRHGLPHSAAERVLAINAMRNPNFASGEVDVYAD